MMDLMQPSAVANDLGAGDPGLGPRGPESKRRQVVSILCLI